MRAIHRFARHHHSAAWRTHVARRMSSHASRTRPPLLVLESHVRMAGQRALIDTLPELQRLGYTSFGSELIIGSDNHVPTIDDVIKNLRDVHKVVAESVFTNPRFASSPHTEAFREFLAKKEQYPVDTLYRFLELIKPGMPHEYYQGLGQFFACDGEARVKLHEEVQRLGLNYRNLNPKHQTKSFERERHSLCVDTADAAGMVAANAMISDMDRPMADIIAGEYEKGNGMVVLIGARHVHIPDHWTETAGVDQLLKKRGIPSVILYPYDERTVAHNEDSEEVLGDRDLPSDCVQYAKPNVPYAIEVGNNGSNFLLKAVHAISERLGFSQGRSP